MNVINCDAKIEQLFPDLAALASSYLARNTLHNFKFVKAPTDLCFYINKETKEFPPNVFHFIKIS